MFKNEKEDAYRPWKDGRYGLLPIPFCFFQKGRDE